MIHLPSPDDFIDIHIHGGKPREGIFMVESLMAHENKLPEIVPGIAFTYGIHPWFLEEGNRDIQMKLVRDVTGFPGIIAVGEAGFDKLRGPGMELQRAVFEEQVIIAEERRLPLIIHCVRAWDEVLAVHKSMKPGMPWMIHGFRGKMKLAGQLIEKGIYLSIWVTFAMRSESSELMRELPACRFFLETDGADVDIRDIYNKVSSDRQIAAEELKSMMYNNFNKFFKTGTDK